MSRPDNTARSRALQRLALLKPKLFKQVLNEERQELGLPPVGQTPTGRKPTKK